LILLIIADILLAFGITCVFTDRILFSLVYSLILPLAMFSFRTFEEEYISEPSEQLIRTTMSAAFAVMFAVLIYSFINIRPSFRKMAFSVFVSVFVISLLNSLVSKVIRKYTKPKKYLVIGKKKEISHVLDEITEKSRGKCLFVDYINPSPEALKEKIRAHENVLVANYEIYEHVESLLENSRVKVEYLSELAEKVLKRIPLEVIDRFKEYYELEFQKAKESPAKRIVDMFGAIVGSVISCPLVLFFAIWIMIEDGRPVLFKQLRVGKNGKYFKFIKLRSLKEGGFDPNNPNGTISTRLLKVGKIIRPLRIDELPQFWLVLKGEMSLVGPRPEMVEYHRAYSNKIPYYNYRLKLKPGIAGWAQINYRHTTTLEEYKRKTEYDLYYIKNRSTILDLKIILQTIEAVFWKRGAK